LENFTTFICPFVLELVLFWLDFFSFLGDAPVNGWSRKSG